MKADPRGPLRRILEIPGQEYEHCTVAQIDARIDHIEWCLSIGKHANRGMPYTGPGAEDMVVELEMLRYQWRGNALIRERGAL